MEEHPTPPELTHICEFEPIPRIVLDMLPIGLIKNKGVVPVRFSDNCLLVATARLDGGLKPAGITLITGCPVKFVCVPQEEIDGFIQRHYSEGNNNFSKLFATSGGDGNPTAVQVIQEMTHPEGALNLIVGGPVPDLMEKMKAEEEAQLEEASAAPIEEPVVENIEVPVVEDRVPVEEPIFVGTVLPAVEPADPAPEAVVCEMPEEPALEVMIPEEIEAHPDVRQALANLIEMKPVALHVVMPKPDPEVHFEIIDPPLVAPLPDFVVEEAGSPEPIPGTSMPERKTPRASSPQLCADLLLLIEDALNREAAEVTVSASTDSFRVRYLSRGGPISPEDGAWDREAFSRTVEWIRRSADNAHNTISKFSKFAHEIEFDSRLLSCSVTLTEVSGSALLQLRFSDVRQLAA